MPENMEEPNTEDSQVSAKKKKEEKSRQLSEENSQVGASPLSCLVPGSLEAQDTEHHESVRKKSKKKKAEKEACNSPLDNSQVTAGSGLLESSPPLSLLTISLEEQNAEDSESVRKKSKKKKKKVEKEASDSPLDNSQVIAGNGLNEEGETETYKSKKKKKKSQPLNGENSLLESFPPSSLLTTEHHESVRKKSKKKEKKKAEKEACNSPLDNSQVIAGNSLNGDGETETYKSKKKKKRSRPLNGENSLLESSPPSSLLTTSLEEQNAEDSESVRKKSKKEKAEKEPSYSPLGNSWDIAGNELNEGVEGSICVSKKKKRKKKHLAGGQQGDDAQFVVPETQEEDISENLHLVSSPMAKDKNVELPPAKQSGALDCVPETPEKLHGPPTTPSLRPPVPKKRRAKQKNLGKSSSDHEEGNSGSGVSGMQDLPDLTIAAVDSSQKQKPGQKRTISELGEGRPARVRKRARPSSDVSDAPGAAEEAEKPAGKAKKRHRRMPLKSHTSKGKHKRQASSKVAHSEAEDGSLPCDGSPSGSLALDEEDEEQLSTQDLETLIKQLEEFIPHVRNLAEEGIRQLACRDLERFRKFKKQGIAVKFGKFSSKENTQLRKNVKDFMEDYEIDSAEKLFFPHRFPEDLEFLKKLRKNNFFALKIAENIPRPWRLVYYRARKMFDPLNYNGRYTEEELNKIKKYQAMYGNNWKKISEMMCRSSHSLEDRYSTIKSNPNHGPWTTEEVQKLLKVMKTVLRLKVKRENAATGGRKRQKDLQVSHEMLYKNIPWSQVEDEVGTRTWRQCKRKWFTILAHKMCPWEKKNHDLELLKIKIELIERLYELRVEDQHEIDWLEISKNFGGLPPTYLQGIYYRLKISFVGHWHTKSFTDIITLLHDVKLPDLKDLLDILMQRQSAQPSQKNPGDSKETYLFSEIFSDSDLEAGLDSKEEGGRS